MSIDNEGEGDPSVDPSVDPPAKITDTSTAIDPSVDPSADQYWLSAGGSHSHPGCHRASLNQSRKTATSARTTADLTSPTKQPICASPGHNTAI